MNFAVPLFIAILALIMPLKSLMIIIVVLCVFDLITGIIKDIKKRNNEEKLKENIICLDNNLNWFQSFIKKMKMIQSRKLRRSIIKIFWYNIILILFYISINSLFGLGPALIIGKVVAASLYLVELRSICENLDKITNKNIFITIFGKVNKYVVESISKMIEK